MNTDFSSFQQIKDSFLQELKDADAGKKTSLPYIINTLPPSPIVKNGEQFQVVVIGGTHATVATCKKEENVPKVLSHESLHVPQFTTLQVFLDFLTPLVLSSTKTLAVNFAFPLNPIFRNDMVDGTFLRGGGKEHIFEGLVGKNVGEEIEKYFEKRNQKILVSVANDTICLLLSGLEKVSWKHLGAGIVGSGMNFAVFLDKTKPVNLESANFNKFTQSETGKEIDEESTNPGRALYEKEVSGVYLFKHYNKELEKQKLNLSPILKTVELENLARNKDELAIMLLQRSASLIACQIAAIMDFKTSDMTFVMEGSVFWKGFEYKKTIEEVLPKLSSFKAKFIHTENSNIIGAAHLVI